jgi:hypothetical protein
MRREEPVADRRVLAYAPRPVYKRTAGDIVLATLLLWAMLGYGCLCVVFILSIPAIGFLNCVKGLVFPGLLTAICAVVAIKLLRGKRSNRGTAPADTGDATSDDRSHE